MSELLSEIWMCMCNVHCGTSGNTIDECSEGVDQAAADSMLRAGAANEIWTSGRFGQVDLPGELGI